MRFSPALLLLLSSWSVANQPNLINHQIDDHAPSVEPQKIVQNVERVREKSPQKTMEITEKDLLSNPKLLSHGLDNAIAAEDQRAVSLLLPVYKKLPPARQDQQLIRYAEALLARKHGNLSLAIARYREMIAENPDLLPVRLQLAMALLSDHQDEAAKGQFERLQAEQLPENVRNIVEAGLQRVRDRRSWSFNASGYYRYEDNINGSPKRRDYGQWHFEAPRKAHGIHLEASAEKRIPFQNGFYGQIEGSVATDWYWDAHDYDDFNMRLAAGGGWQNALWDVSVTPFVKQRIYGGKKYSTFFGSDLSLSYWLTPQWRLSSSAQFTHKKHNTRTHLDGNQYFFGVSGLYLHNARQYWFGGANVLVNNARDESESYKRLGVSAGWGQEWGWGISSRLSGSVSRSKYKAEGFAFGVQDHTDYSATLSLWNRDFYFFGITPRLTFNWTKSKSNYPLHEKDDSIKTYLEFSRSF